MKSMRKVFILVVLWLSYLHGQDSDAACIQQGFLRLDKPTKPSGSNVDWPVCQEYQSCSCCNVSHVLTIERYFKNEDSKTPSRCQLALLEAACRVCHPEVGLGILEKVCLSQCDEWYSHCQEEYFAFDQITGRLILCKATTQLICTKLNELFKNGTTFCEQLGIQTTVAVDEECWFEGKSTSEGFCHIRISRPLLSFQDVKYILLLLLFLLSVWIIPYLGLPL